MLGDILTEYNFLEHVASDVGVDQRFLSTEGCQNKSRKIALWTEDNLMRLKQLNTNYIIFTRSRQVVATRITVNNKLIERQR